MNLPACVRPPRKSQRRFTLPPTKTPPLAPLKPFMLEKCWPKMLCRLGNGVPVARHEDGSLEWQGSAGVGIIGSPRAFHPLNLGALGDINEARMTGYRGFVKDGGELRLQGAEEPAYGYCTTTTAYRKPGHEIADVRSSLDAEADAYVSLPARIWLHAAQLPGPLLGCLCHVFDPEKFGWIMAVVGDVDDGDGRLSLAAWGELTHGTKYQRGGCLSGMVWRVFPGVPCPGYELQPWNP